MDIWAALLLVFVSCKNVTVNVSTRFYKCIIFWNFFKMAIHFSLRFCYCGKHHDQMQLGEERFISSYRLRSAKGSRGRKTRQEPRNRADTLFLPNYSKNCLSPVANTISLWKPLELGLHGLLLSVLWSFSLLLGSFINPHLQHSASFLVLSPKVFHTSQTKQKKNKTKQTN